jgi:YD repeat-containing protein
MSGTNVNEATVDAIAGWNGAEHVPGFGEQALPSPYCTAASTNLESTFSGGSVRYFDGAVKLTTTDIVSDGLGLPFSQTRSWSNDLDPAALTASMSTGHDWTISQFPGIVQVDSSTFAVVSNSYTARYFDYSGGVYTERFAGKDTLTYDGTADQYVLTTPQGVTFRFESFSTSLPTAEQGQFASRTDAYGNLTQVVDRNSDGQITEVQRGGGAEGAGATESWLYTYLPSTDANAGLLDSVTLRRGASCGAPWTTVREVTYSYYGSSDANGNLGDLESSSVWDAGDNLLGTDYYRYYTADTYDGDTQIGYAHGLKYYLSAQSFDRMTGAASYVATYADDHFQYNSDHRVSVEDVQGQGCSACSGGIGHYTFAYTDSSNTAGPNSWARETVEGLPDGNENIVYSNAYGEPMLVVFHDTTANQKWINLYQYDSSDRCVLAASPAAVGGYSPGSADLSPTLTTGLITTFDYYSLTTATSTAAGGVAGAWKGVSIQRGPSGTPIRQLDLAYYQITSTLSGVAANPLASSTVYRNDNGTGAETTKYCYSFYSGTAQVKTYTISDPIIGASQNGPGTADREIGVADQYNRLIWVKDRGGFLNQFQYDDATGAMTSQTLDVNTSLTGTYTGLPSGWSTPTGGGLNLTTTQTVDDIGRATEITTPAGNITYLVYHNSTHEVRIYAGWNATTHLPTGPTQVVRGDRGHSYVETLTMSATPTYNSTTNAPTGWESIGGLQTLSRQHFNEAGQADKSDAYFNLAGVTYSTAFGLGTAGTNFYETDYGYDDRGRPDRTQTPNGTITRMVYDGSSALGSAPTTRRTRAIRNGRRTIRLAPISSK